MRYDIEYAKSILRIFEENEDPTCNVFVLKEKGFDLEHPEFIFHMDQLYRRGYIIRSDGLSGIGYVASGYSEQEGNWMVIELKLTYSAYFYLN